jgi:hypothetical protein
MASLTKSLELKKIIFQISYLNAEQNEILYKCDSIDQEISDYIKQNYPEQYKEFVKPNEITTESITEKDNDNDSQLKCQNKDIKKLYRKIVELTHPDKAEDQEDIFREATRAYKEENLAMLLEIASELRIKISELSDESMELVEENIQDLQIKVDELKQSTAWVWYNCKSSEEKDMLARMILSYKGIEVV